MDFTSCCLHCAILSVLFVEPCQKSVVNTFVHVTDHQGFDVKSQGLLTSMLHMVCDTWVIGIEDESLPLKVLFELEVP